MSLAVCTAGLCGNETTGGAFVHAIYSFSLLGTGVSSLDLLQLSKDLKHVTHDYIMEYTRTQLVGPNYLHSSKLDAYLRVAGYRFDQWSRAYSLK